MTIAEKLHGKLVESVEVPGNVDYDSQTGIFTFEDKSLAKQLTTFETCKPYVAADLSTQAHKRIRKWSKV